MKVTSKHIHEALERYSINHKYALKNAYVFDWESDFFSITKTGTIYEYEIKVSRADFKRDFIKEKHFLFQNHSAGYFIKKGKETESFQYDFIERERKKYSHCPIEIYHSDKIKIPARFYYVCPAGLLNIYDIPKYAGLMIYQDGHVVEIKKAPLLHKRGYKEMKLTQVLLDKFYWLSVEQGRVIKYKNSI